MTCLCQLIPTLVRRMHYRPVKHACLDPKAETSWKLPGNCRRRYIFLTLGCGTRVRKVLTVPVCSVLMVAVMLLLYLQRSLLLFPLCLIITKGLMRRKLLAATEILRARTMRGNARNQHVRSILIQSAVRSTTYVLCLQ